MSRNWLRSLTLALALIVGLGVALPAAAMPEETAAAVEEGLLDRIWSWVQHLWSGEQKPEKGPRPTTAPASGGGCDRGILIDPNGVPCHG